MSCGQREAPTKTPTPAGYYPEHFPDIPLPQFYTRKHGCDQVAISFAGGALRHFDITLEEIDLNSKAKRDEDLLKWYQVALPDSGWKPHPNKMLPHNAQQYKKQYKGREEVLELRTGRDKKLGIIRLRLVR